MKNKFLYFVCFYFYFTQNIKNEIFEFDVKNINIQDKGNRFSKKGCFKK